MYFSVGSQDLESIQDLCSKVILVHTEVTDEGPNSVGK